MWFQVAAVFGAGLTVVWRAVLIYRTQRAEAGRSGDRDPPGQAS
jgi:hypothetical protein